jgi:sugar lactone lactonase YvrE
VELARDRLLAAPPDQAPVGRLVRVEVDSGNVEVVADGLSTPDGVVLRDDNAYVTTGRAARRGQVVVIPLGRH